MHRGYCALCGKRTVIDSSGRCMRGHWADAIPALHDMDADELERTLTTAPRDLVRDDPGETREEREAPPEKTRRVLAASAMVFGVFAVVAGGLLLLMPLRSQSGDAGPAYRSSTSWRDGVTIKDFRVSAKRGDNEVPVTAVVPADDAIELAGKVIGIAMPVIVSGRLTHVDTGTFTDAIAETLRADERVAFVFPKPGEHWQTGLYRASVMVDGKPIATAEFQIR